MSRIRILPLLLLLVAAVASPGSESESIDEDYSSDTTQQNSKLDEIVWLDNFVLTDEDRKKLLFSANEVLPKRGLEREDVELEVSTERGHIYAWLVFAAERTSRNRTEYPEVDCTREYSNPLWQCKPTVIPSSEQLLTSGSKPTLIQGPIDELDAADIANTLRIFINENLDEPPEKIEINSMARSRINSKCCGEGWANEVRLTVRIGDCPYSLMLGPLIRHSSQLEVASIRVDYPNANARQCDSSISAVSAKLIQAAEKNQPEKLQMHDDTVQVLLGIIRPMLDFPVLLTRFKPPTIGAYRGHLSVWFKFGPIVESPDRTVGGSVNCVQEIGASSWKCTAHESMGLKILGQEGPIEVTGGLTDVDVFRMVDYVRKMVAGRLELDEDVSELQFYSAERARDWDSSGRMSLGPIVIAADLDEHRKLQVEFDFDAFKTGELLVVGAFVN